MGKSIPCVCVEWNPSLFINERVFFSREKKFRALISWVEVENQCNKNDDRDVISIICQSTQLLGAVECYHPPEKYQIREIRCGQCFWFVVVVFLLNVCSNCPTEHSSMFPFCLSVSLSFENSQ